MNLRFVLAAFVGTILILTSFQNCSGSFGTLEESLRNAAQSRVTQSKSAVVTPNATWQFGE